MKIKEIIFLNNGNTMVFGEDGQQIPELQFPYITREIYMAELEKRGIRREGLEYISNEN